MARERLPRATIDFEGRSAADLKRWGAVRYATDPSTEVLCLVYRLPGFPPGKARLWHPAFPDHGIQARDVPQDLFDYIAAGGMVEAHNAGFERAIWLHVMVKRHGWPAMPHRQWQCSSAKASAHALPRALKDVCRVMRTAHQKDDEGQRRVKAMWAPRKVTKAELRAGVSSDAVLWHFSRTLFDQLLTYCAADVLAEDSLSESLRDLSEREQELWLHTQETNERGVPVDMEGVEAAIRHIEALTGGMRDELAELTGGAVERPTQRQRVKAWLSEAGVDLPDTQGDTVDAVLAHWPADGRADAMRVLEILRECNRSSTAKYYAIREAAVLHEDGVWRVHNMEVYHGASTGRWTGAGPQPHNFPRGNIKSAGAMEQVWRDLKELATDVLEMLYGDVMELLSSALRGVFVASPGKRLLVADYSAIEARVVLWLAGETEALRIIRNGGDIYLDLATAIYGRTCTKADKNERQLGKQGILGCGFGMGAQKFLETCAKYGIIIGIVMAKLVVDTYRSRYPSVKKMWYEQEKAACRAVTEGGTVTAGMARWRVVGRFLYCLLPGGGELKYCDPVVVDDTTPWGEPAQKLTFMSVNPLTRKWERTETWGGTIVENQVQHIARQIMASGRLRCADSGTYDVLWSSHDEIIAEADHGRGSVEEFEELVGRVDPWGHGLPMVAAGWEGPRYMKG